MFLNKKKKKDNKIQKQIHIHFLEEEKEKFHNTNAQIIFFLFSSYNIF